MTEANVMFVGGMLAGRGFVSWKDESQSAHTELGARGVGRKHLGRPHIGKGSAWFQS